MTQSRHAGAVGLGHATASLSPAAAQDERSGVWFDSVLRGARADAGWAYEQLWTAYSGRVLGYLRRQGAREPEELTNEAFLDAFRAIGRFEGDEVAFRSWLFTIVHRRLIDARRAEARRPATVTLDDRRAPTTDGALDEALASLRDSDVEQLVDELPPLERDVLLLRIVAGLDADEVGRVVDRRAGTVRMIQHRALNALRERLEGEA